MIHSFDTEVAKDVGVVGAIIYSNILYWCVFNKENNLNERDGHFWTYNSIAELCKVFDYLTRYKIEYALKVLEEKGYIIKGEYNKASYDRTNWYTVAKYPSPISENQRMDSSILRNGLTDFTESITRISEMDYSNFRNGLLEFPKSITRNSEIDYPNFPKPIPDIKTQIENTDIKTNSKKVRKKSSELSFDEILDSYTIIQNNPDLRETFVDFIKSRKSMKSALTNKALKLNINKAIELGDNEPEKTRLVVEQTIANGWKGMFPLKNETKTTMRKSGNEFTDLLSEEGFL